MSVNMGFSLVRVIYHDRPGFGRLLPPAHELHSDDRASIYVGDVGGSCPASIYNIPRTKLQGRKAKSINQPTNDV